MGRHPGRLSRGLIGGLSLVTVPEKPGVVTGTVTSDSPLLRALFLLVMLAAPVLASSVTPKEALGYKLFFDPILSRPKNFSCATCHVPEKGFEGGEALSKGAGREVDLLIGATREEVNLYMVPTGLRRRLPGFLAAYALRKGEPDARAMLRAYGLGTRGRMPGAAQTARRDGRAFLRFARGADIAGRRASRAARCGRCRSS